MESELSLFIMLNEDVIFHCETSVKQGIILYGDQSKAFDRVEWKWMRLVFEKFNFGQKFISWINTLYKKQKVPSLQMALFTKCLVYHAV